MSSRRVLQHAISLLDTINISSSLIAALSLCPLLALAQSPSPWACKVPPLPIAGARMVNVSSEPQLQSAIGNLQAGDTILIADGTYNLSKTLYVSKNNVTIRGASGCDGVVLVGNGMDNANFGSVQEGIWSDSANTTVAHLTLRDTWENELIFNYGAQSPHVYSVKLLNSGSQFIKSNPSGTVGVGNDNGVIEYSWFEYLNGPPTNPNHAGGSGYTNGMSIHAVKNWTIRGNFFKNFHTPDTSSYAWNPAVLVWNHSADTLTEQNVFIDVDRAIAYGLTERNPGFDHQGGTIRNNFITYTVGLMSAGRTASSDGAIIVWDSPNTFVYHNSILTNGNVVHSIEFRFVETAGGEARNNLADATINLRDSATAIESGNLLTTSPSLFVDPANGDLHLLPTATAAIDQAPALPAVTNDIDGASRPQGCCYDIGADEFDVGGSPDAGPGTDAGAPPQDAGGPPGDAGTSPPDSGIPIDAGIGPPDSGAATDAGGPQRSGPPPSGGPGGSGSGPNPRVSDPPTATSTATKALGGCGSIPSSPNKPLLVLAVIVGLLAGLARRRSRTERATLFK